MALSLISYITFAASERNMGHAIGCDYTGGFVYQYYMTPTAGRGGIAKIRISDFTRVANVTFACSPLSSGGGGAVIDSANGYAYIVAGNRVKQLNIAGFSVGLDSFFGDANGEIVIDSAGTYLYTSLHSNSTARRLLATSLGLVSQVVVGGGLTPTAVQVDFARGNMYVGCNNTTTVIKKVKLSDFTVTDITLPAGANAFHGSAYDTVNDRIYFVGAGRIVRINPADDSYTVAVPTVGVVGSNAGFIIACPNTIGGGVLYIGNGNASPPSVSEVSMATLTANVTLTLTATPGAGATGGARDPSTGKLYVCINGDPGYVNQLQGTADIPTAVPKGGGPSVKRRPYPFNPNMISSSGNGNGGFGMNQKIIRP